MRVRDQTLSSSQRSLMPVARLPKLSDRTSGVLLHPTSLPGGWEGGDLGAEARAFVDFLADAGQSWWQMLPVGPTGYANSPYSAQSAFAGNPLLIDSERRLRRLPVGKRSPAHAKRAVGERLPRPPPRRRDPQPRLSGLRQGSAALAGGLRPLRRDQAAAWAAAVDALAGTAPRSRPEGAQAFQDRSAGGPRARPLHPVAFFPRLARVRDYAHARGVALIGDIPIFMAHDSADVWKERGLYHLDRAGEGTLIAGVAARLLQRDRAALGQPALPVGADAEDWLCLVDRTFPRHTRRL